MSSKILRAETVTVFNKKVGAFGDSRPENHTENNNATYREIRNGNTTQGFLNVSVFAKHPMNASSSHHATKQNHPAHLQAPNHTVYTQMMALNLRSAGHQEKFLARKDLVSRFPLESRFKANSHRYSAYDLTDHYAFMHLWKCGGTSVENMGVQQHWLDQKQIKSKAWIALVRDPIEHFLSAWAEIRYRRYLNRKKRRKEEFRHPENEEWMIGDYDQRVKTFLAEVKSTIWPETIRSENTHANPQANFLMDENGTIFDNVQVMF
ncbi:MAG: hypothetical protein SGARI_005661 [Bacillariaceae sp.]